jgi:hypothetical protein
VSAIGRALVGDVAMVGPVADAGDVDADEGDVTDEGVTVEPTLPSRPALPPAHEVERHSLTHLPYKPWCSICIAARARDASHRQLPEREGEAPVVEMDYLFLKSALTGDSLVPVLVLVEKGHSYGAGIPCRAKGRADSYVLQAAMEFLLEAGLTGTLRLRTDAEPAIQAVAQAIAARRSPARTVVEVTPVGSSSSLGSAERLAQDVGAGVRTLTMMVEQRWNVKVAADSPITGWMVLHAGWLRNRFQSLQRLQSTPFEALQHRCYRGALFAFGEPVLARDSKATQLPKMQQRWVPGIWLGVQLQMSTS